MVIKIRIISIMTGKLAVLLLQCTIPSQRRKPALVAPSRSESDMSAIVEKERKDQQEYEL
ncbi:hypothetical protein J1614_004730 [Plenodomus biglobosus]|nr:hypothetical protein J1614_004730 [Plenodomus biglobosus]